MRAWRGPGGEEESRAYLQARLVVLSKVMFWNFVVLMVFLAVLYAVYADLQMPDGRTGLAPKYNNVVYVMSGGGLFVLGIVWRVVLVRHELSLRKLEAIDVFYSVGTGVIFGAAGALTPDLRSSAYICLIYACLMVLLRASVVPSTGKRTALISVITCLPMTVATLVIGFEQDIPAGAYVGGGALICTMAILLATVGSSILYGLRRQVNAAMQLGQYTLDGKIGEGGNGAVYRARHAMLRRPTAVKLMLPDRIDSETLDRFEREVQHMSQLTHPNSVAVYDYGRSSEGVFYYAMEYLDGIDLEKLVMRFGAQPADRVIPILIQVCGALQEAHRRGLTHRDIKPANIILCERGDVPDVAKVVDFGLVKELGLNDGHSRRGILGTPAYIAPESVTSPDQVGPAVDLYALGAVGYFLVTGMRVFDGVNSVEVCAKHVTAAPVPPSQITKAHVPSQLEEILLRCLAKRPQDRPANADELARQLRTVPRSVGWTDEQALGWWIEFRRLEPPNQATARTNTITIDIDHRTPLAGRPELSR